MTSPIKILLVDDVDQNLVALDALLRREDVLPLQADNGAAALELLLEHDIALALIDVQMPEMDGFELAELMRGSPRTRHVPIIFLTASDRDTKRMFKGYEAGAVDFLYKPFDPHILRSKAEIFIQLHQQKLLLAEQLETMKQLVRTNDMFVAVLGHDLRNPLSAVMMNAEIVRRAASATSMGQGAAAQTAVPSSAPLAVSPHAERLQIAGDRIAASGRRMAQMIDQLLDVSRVRSGQMQISPEACDLRTVTQTIVDEFHAVDVPAAIHMDVRGDTHGVWDKGSIAQVLSNLLGNALRHGTADCPIGILLDGVNPAEVTVSITNGGVIPAAIQPHLFRPFHSGNPQTAGTLAASHAQTLNGTSALAQQGPSATDTAALRASPTPSLSNTARAASAQSAGLGLGLYIVHELVRLHAGTIVARSSVGAPSATALDSGTTTFEVRLPRHAEWRTMRDTAQIEPGAASAFATAPAR